MVVSSTSSLKKPEPKKAAFKQKELPGRHSLVGWRCGFREKDKGFCERVDWPDNQVRIGAPVKYTERSERLCGERSSYEAHGTGGESQLCSLCEVNCDARSVYVIHD